MRPPSELRRLALETGTFENYQGDGASVPWLEAGLVSLALPQPLLAYKFYLDANWPQAFKLHDWCYTPYGTLINVTREEADNALYEDILLDSPVDALIVYSAVRIGGGPWFGRSLTGYSGLQTYRSGLNIPGRNIVDVILGDP